MSGVSVGDGVSWIPGPRRRRVRCLLRGHAWEAQPAAFGCVLAQCAGCRELLAARFVGVDDVLGLAPVEGRSRWLGEASAGRRSLRLVAAALSTPPAAAIRQMTAAAGARPAAQVDSLTRLSAVLAQLAAFGMGVEAEDVLGVVRGRAEVELLEAALRGVD